MSAADDTERRRRSSPRCDACGADSADWRHPGLDARLCDDCIEVLGPDIVGEFIARERLRADGGARGDSDDESEGASMSWARLDDSFPEHAKIEAVGPMGMALQIRMICYCARNLTDGFISTSAATRLACDLPRGTIDRNVNVRVAGSKAGLLDVVEGGYLVHDYLVYNPTRAESVAKREAAAERVSRHRVRKADDTALFDDVMERDGRKCQFCGSTEKLTLDHIHPVQYGGKTEMRNTRILCRPCNSARGNKLRKQKGVPSRNALQSGFVTHDETSPRTRSPAPDQIDPPPSASDLRQAAERILAAVNAASGRGYRLADSTLKPITAALQGVRGKRAPMTEDELLAIVESKRLRWSDDPKTQAWIRPSTLFRPSHLEEYLAEARTAPPTASGKSAAPHFEDIDYGKTQA